jgi:hypothetical protein
MHHGEIHKLAVELLQNEPGSANYLRSYSQACRQVEKGLTENQCQSYKAMAKDWTNEQLPPREQQRYIHGK